MLSFELLLDQFVNSICQLNLSTQFWDSVIIALSCIVNCCYLDRLGKKSVFFAETKMKMRS